MNPSAADVLQNMWIMYVALIKQVVQIYKLDPVVIMSVVLLVRKTLEKLLDFLDLNIVTKNINQGNPENISFVGKCFHSA